MTEAAVPLWPAPPERLYGLFDAGMDAALYPALRTLAETEDIVALYEGETAENLADVAPYLIALDADGPSFDWLWPRFHECGLLLAAAGDIAAVRAHLRRLTRVHTDDGRALLFRFYDPKVLSALLPTCDAAQLTEIFGPLARILCGPPGRLLAHRVSSGALAAVPVISD